MSDNTQNKQRIPLGRGGPHGMGGRGVEKPKDFKASIKKLFAYSKSFLPFMIVSVILAIVASILSVIGPNKLSDLTNHITKNMFGGIDLSFVANIGCVLVLIYALSLIFNLIQGQVMAYTAQKVSQKIRSDLNTKLTKLPFSYIDANAYGNLMSRMTNDVDTIGQGLNSSIAVFIGAVALLIASLVMMFVTNWIMALTAILSTMLGFVLITLIMKKSQKYFSAQQRILGELNGHIEESFTAHDIIKIYNATKHKTSEFERINQSMYESTWKSQFFGGIMPSLMGFVGNLGYVAVCVIGAVLASNGLISIGTIVAFILYVRLFSNPLNQIAQSMNFLQTTAAASERVFQVLEEGEVSADEKTKEFLVEDVKGEVEFEHVNFAYEKGKTIIKDFSASVKSGQKVAIVGPTGAGKTTLVNLLMRFYEIDGGSIKIDGVDIKEMEKSALRSVFGMVLQDTWLFEGTIRDNLVFNQKDVTDEKLDEVCEASGLTHFINTLPNGYDTMLDDNTAISVGQKQLMTIARSMLQNRPLLILDEATSSIDTRTEILIQNAMDKLTQKRTSFVIAHRLSTIKNADLIIVIKEGDIVEQGKHQELLVKNGFYASLYNSQFEQ